MRFNDRELSQLCFGNADMEGVLNHKRPQSGNFSQSAFKSRLFKLKANLLFYFKIDDVGKLNDRQPAGVFVLENSNVQYEVCNEVPFAFSLSFRDDPDRKHIFAGRSESYIEQWVLAIKKSSYEYWRSRLIVLQTKLNLKTGKDPLQTFPRNQGVVRDIQPPGSPKMGSPGTGFRRKGLPRSQSPQVGSHSASFRSHLQTTTPATAVPCQESGSTFQTPVQNILALSSQGRSSVFQSHVQVPTVTAPVQAKSVSPYQEKNLIEL